MYPSLKILKKSCKKFWYEFDIIDDVSKNLFQVSDWNRFFFANNHQTGMFPINHNFSSSIVADKAFCYQILKKHNFRIPEWKHFFINSDYNGFIHNDNKQVNINKYVNTLWYPIFVKPNNASLWKWAEVIYNNKDLKKHLEEIKNISDICLVQEYVKAQEYRIFVVNWEIQFTYKRSSANIKWDWKNNIKKLLKKASHLEFLNSKFFLWELIKKNLTLNSILPKNDFINLHSKSNISAGWEISEFKINHWIKLEKWVKKLVSKFDIWVCGIDIFAPKWINSPKDFIIIELNSNPSLVATYELWYKKLVLSIWKKIMMSYFWKKNNLDRKYRWISNILSKNKKSKKIKSSL
mgnify:CR=1 FL=1|jgi:glutathione synthase/RimK-type ligase-like ATP-grasp enzyme